MKFKSKMLTVVLMISSVVVMSVHAGKREEFRVARDACFAEAGIAKPEKGTPPSDEVRAVIKTCLEGKGFTKPKHSRHRGPKSEEMREAMKACGEELGLVRPAKGERPSKENREKMRACLEGKGFTKP